MSNIGGLFSTRIKQLNSFNLIVILWIVNQTNNRSSNGFWLFCRLIFDFVYTVFMHIHISFIQWYCAVSVFCGALTQQLIWLEWIGIILNECL